ncbi:MAG: hypothetical protein WAS21_26165 [Geminicoccaceae bacterium]
MTLSKYLFSAALAVGMTIVTASAAMTDKGENSGPAVAAGVAPATASGDRWAVINSGCSSARSIVAWIWQESININGLTKTADLINLAESNG